MWQSSINFINKKRRLMKSKIFPNFWQGLIIVLILDAVLALFYWGSFTVFNFFYLLKDYFYAELTFAVSSLLLIPFIVFIKNKGDTGLLGQIHRPSFRGIVFVFFIAFAVEMITHPTFTNPSKMVELIGNDKLGILNFETPKFDKVVLMQFIHLVLLAPVFEELLFRGLILNQFFKKYRPVTAIVLSSILFAICHISMERIIALFISGIVFGAVYYFTRSLTLPILLHSFGNMLGRFLRIKEVELSFYVAVEYFAIIITGAVIVMIILRRMKRTGEKL